MEAVATLASMTGTSAPTADSQPLGTLAPASAVAPRTAYAVLAAVSVSHLLNDTIQSLLPAIYPVLKESFGLSFSQIGLMTLALMLTASVLQPVVGLITDRRPAPLALVVGMSFTLAGLLLLSGRLDLSAAAARRRARRHRVVGLPS